MRKVVKVVLITLLIQAVAYVAYQLKAEADRKVIVDDNITLVELAGENCEADSAPGPVKLTKKAGGYIVDVNTEIPCDDYLDYIYLNNLAVDKSTLVISYSPGWSPLGFRKLCSCALKLSVSIEEKKLFGDTLYVVLKHQVLGHFKISKTASVKR